MRRDHGTAECISCVLLLPFQGMGVVGLLPFIDIPNVARVIPYLTYTESFTYFHTMISACSKNCVPTMYCLKPRKQEE